MRGNDQTPDGTMPATMPATMPTRGYTSRELLQAFWPYLRPHKGRIIVAILALTLVAVALLCMGRGLAYLVDEGLGKGDPALLNRAVLATALIAVVLAFGSFLRTTMVNKIGELVLADIRRAVFGHVMTLSTNWFENNRTGDVLARITTDTTVDLNPVHGGAQSIVADRRRGDGGSVERQNVVGGDGGCATGGVAIDYFGTPAARLVAFGAGPAGRCRC